MAKQTASLGRIPLGNIDWLLAGIIFSVEAGPEERSRKGPQALHLPQVGITWVTGYSTSTGHGKVRTGR